MCVVRRLSLFLLALLTAVNGELSLNNQKLEWIVGKWRSEFSGKVGALLYLLYINNNNPPTDHVYAI